MYAQWMLEAQEAYRLDNFRKVPGQNLKSLGGSEGLTISFYLYKCVFVLLPYCS